MTADERALLNAIIAAPEDDLPRLVYADWLEEQGRVRAAELLRCEGYRAGGDPKQHVSLREAYPDLADRLVYVPSSTPAIVAAIGCGIVFFMAWWSGPARRAFAELANVIRASDPDGRLLIVVLDVDGATESYEQVFRELGPLSMGSGQTFWVWSGRVYHVNRVGLQTDRLAAITDELLSACESQ